MHQIDFVKVQQKVNLFLLSIKFFLRKRLLTDHDTYYCWLFQKGEYDIIIDLSVNSYLLYKIGFIKMEPIYIYFIEIEFGSEKQNILRLGKKNEVQ